MSPPHSSGTGSGARRRSRRTVLAAVGTALALVAGGVLAVLVWTGDGPSDDADSASAGRSGAEVVALRTEVAQIAGRMRRGDKRRLEEEVGAVVEKFVTDAYVEGGTAFPGFNDKARRLARQDADVTTGRRLLRGGDVAIRSGTVSLSVLSPRPWDPVGVTARVRLVLDAEAGPRPVTVTGRLLLSPVARGWQIFGYDLATSAPPDANGTKGAS